MKAQRMFLANLAATTSLLLLIAISANAGTGYLGGYTRIIYQTETASSRIETTTTEIMSLGGGQYSVQTTRDDLAREDEIRLSFFGDAAQTLGLYMDDDADSPFDLSQLAALSDEELEENHTYILADGWSFQTAGAVSVAGLAGIEGILVQADTPAAIVRVVLADDLYIRQFLPFPLRVELEYVEETEDGIVPVFSGRVELQEYVHVANEEDAS